MNRFNFHKDTLLEINRAVEQLAAAPGPQNPWANEALEKWRQTCRFLQKQLAEEIVKIAVIGPIKSGKSTFVNALMGDDYLKRGAGVVTSIVTRMRQGDRAKATLFLKSVDEINREIEEALVLFPANDWQQQAFDIRRRQDRRGLAKALAALDRALLITASHRNVNDVLLKSYLAGYDAVKAHLKQDTAVLTFEADRFNEHQAFVGDENLAVYMKDVELQIDSSILADSMEIADCQGSDSPNPLHLSMIQDYLLDAHLALYVISSRTGLRRADIRFLSMIKKMGILDNVIFIVNCDFSEHESLPELQHLVERIKAEIALIKPEPILFPLSALYNLFQSMANGQPARKSANPKISDRDQTRFTQWQAEMEFVGYTRDGGDALLQLLRRHVTAERRSLLLKNHLERLATVLSGLHNWVRLHEELLAKDSRAADEMIAGLQHRRQQTDRVQALIKSTLQGAVGNVKQDVRNRVDSFFDLRNGVALGRLLDFVGNYSVAFQEYEESLRTAGFMNTLYLVYQQFKQAVDRYMAHQVNPEIVAFVRQQEKQIEDHLASVAGPYSTMIEDALREYSRTAQDPVSESGGVPDRLPGQPDSMMIQQQHPANEPHIEVNLDLEALKQVSGLTIPPAVATLRYSAGLKSDALMAQGFSTVVQALRRIFPKWIPTPEAPPLKGLEKGVGRLKKETAQSIVSLFKDYRENIKFQYLFKLIDVAADGLRDQLEEHFRSHLTDLSRVADSIRNNRIDKKQVCQLLRDMQAEANKIQARIETLRDGISTVKTI